jgi:flagellin
MNTAMERLSTGLRINSAADDAAGLQIANRLEMQNRGMSVAMRNAQDGISMLQTAEGAMDEMTNIAYRMNDLATQAANGTNTSADRDAMNAEYKQLASELQNIYQNSNFGGRELFTGVDGFSAGAINLQIGSTTSETLSVDVSSEISAINNTLAGFDIMAESEALKTQVEADYQTELDNFAAGATASALIDGTDAGAAVAGSYTDFADLKAKADAGNTVAQTDLAQVISDAQDSLDTALNGTTAGNVYMTNQADYDASGLTTGTGVVGTVSYNDVMSLTTGIYDQASATTAMGNISGLIDDIGATRAQFGANINRLDHTITNLQNMSENLAASKGRITDTDYAVESSNMTKQQMLMQAGTQMLAQSKQLPGMAMSLLG